VAWQDAVRRIRGEIEEEKVRGMQRQVSQDRGTKDGRSESDDRILLKHN